MTTGPDDDTGTTVPKPKGQPGTTKGPFVRPLSEPTSTSGSDDDQKD
ncbi:hypothetical protein [Jannaschia sp. R86511]